MKVIESTDLIEVAFTPLLIYGGSGVGKTTLAQTAAEPLTLDFDEGAHRCANRKTVLQFDSWSENVQAAGTRGAYLYPAGHKLAAQPIPYRTLIHDTGGRALDRMIPEIIGENAKNGQRGGLSQQGWGVLGSRFALWLKLVRSWGKEIVFLCHQKESKDAAGNPYFMPDLPGNMAWNEVHKSFDLMGRIYMDGARRYLDFRPSDTQVGKDAGGLGKVELPDLHEHPRFLAELLARARERIGKTAEASALAAQAVQDWRAWLETVGDNVDALNGNLKELGKLKNGVKAQCWQLVQDHAAARGWEFDREARVYKGKGVAA